MERIELQSGIQPSDIIISKLTRIETVLLGVPGTDDGGLVTDMKIMRELCVKQATEISDHSEAIVRINTRCEERTGCAPLTPAEVKGVRANSSRIKEKVKSGGQYTAIFGGISALLYVITEWIKQA